MATGFLKVKNNATGTLGTAVNSTDNPVDLMLGAGDGAKFPATFPFHVSLEDEILRCTSKPVADTLRCTRAQEGTTAAAHASGKAVELRVTAQQMSDLHGAVNTVETDFAAHTPNADAHHTKLHDHTTADGSGVLTNDEHDGFSQYVAITTPAAPAGSNARLFMREDPLDASKLQLAAIAPDGTICVICAALPKAGLAEELQLNWVE